ncbi:MAG: YfhO family protein, partial [Mucilaginibacter polytrichastri]|nr:YfhO family protein [Mucilaginibacter polytrichastri]
GFLGLRELSENTDKIRLWKFARISLYITGGLCLLVVALPGMLRLQPADSSQTSQLLNQAFQGNAQAANEVLAALKLDRESIARSDAFRSLIFVLLGFGLVWAVIKDKVKAPWIYLVFIVVILVDMWGVDKRYLNKDNFGPKQDANQLTQKREVDEFITRDTEPGYRVLDLTSDPFTNASTSYFYRSLGGYHAAKLKRYQELIENNFSNSINEDVLDMLNTRYTIQTDPKDGSVKMHRNETACGPAWFVKTVRFVKNADEEMEAISSFDPHDVAIVDGRFRSQLDMNKKSVDPRASIKVIDYNPDHLIYEYSSGTAQTAVFSEIYYDKGWNMYVDGEQKPYFRADYLLRAAELPMGNHKVEFKFEPKSYYTGEKISLAASVLLVLGAAGVLFTEFRPKRKKQA